MNGETASPYVKVFDFDGAVDRLAGRADYLRNIIRNFLADTPARLDEMGQALSACSFQDALRLAHALNGAASMIGAARLEKQALALERALKNPDDADLHTIHHDLIAEFAEFKSAIEAFTWPGHA